VKIVGLLYMIHYWEVLFN